jgi:hypothetical protein
VLEVTSPHSSQNTSSWSQSTQASVFIENGRHSVGVSEEGRQTVCLLEAEETEKGRSVILLEAEKTKKGRSEILLEAEKIEMEEDLCNSP